MTGAAQEDRIEVMVLDRPVQVVGEVEVGRVALALVARDDLRLGFDFARDYACKNSGRRTRS